MGSGQPRIEGFKTIWRQTPKVGGGAHYSERIAFAPDGTMFVSSGERFQFEPAQDPNVDLGKVILGGQLVAVTALLVLRSLLRRRR